MTAVFLDTVGLLAVWDATDQWHVAAQHVFDQLLQLNVPLVTTSYVLIECANAASRRPYRSRVNDLRTTLRDDGLLFDPTTNEMEQAWQAYDRDEAGNAGIVDQVSFVVMRRLGLTQAFTNDAHFQAAGFQTLF
jgi:predicted nucleic acid-binding protein